MTVARSKQIDLETTPFYHIISRCVRRSYLCGWDSKTGKDFTYRKKWLIDRLKQQCHAFAIDLAAYAIMDNHYHLVVHVDTQKALGWDDKEIIRRWSLVFPRDAKRIQELRQHQPNHPDVVKAVIKWRDRLMSISWFMRTVNEYIARQCNQEDQCKGRFWEGRFKSQALLDEGALLSAMTYVDLNPIRAGMCNTPEESDFTSIQERLQLLQHQDNNSASKSNHQPDNLMSFQTLVTSNPLDKPFIEFILEDYLHLVDQSGRIFREDKRGAISPQLAPILERIDIKHTAWLKMVNCIESNYAYAVGNKSKLALFGSSERALKGTKLSGLSYLMAS